MLWSTLARFEEGTWTKKYDRLTHRSDNLRLHPVLVLKTTCEITDAPASVPGDIGNPSDVVEHVATREEQDQDQTYAGPQVAVLYDRQDVGVRHREESEGSEKEGHRDGDPGVVDRPADRGVLSSRREVS